MILNANKKIEAFLETASKPCKQLDALQVHKAGLSQQIDAMDKPMSCLHTNRF
jgi:hypothetical protein